MKLRAKLFTAKTLMVAGFMGGMAIPAGAKADNASLTAYAGYAYNIENNSHGPAFKLTGGAEAGGLSASGLINAGQVGRDSTELQLGYSEFRLYKKLPGFFGIGGQYEITSGEDAMRFGAYINPPMPGWMRMQVRILPVSLLTQHYNEAKDFLDTKLALYAAFQLGGGFSAETYWHWVVGQRAVYGEAQLDYALTDWLALGLNATRRFNFDGPDSTTVGARLGLRM
jgi:hypothetical protein